MKKTIIFILLLLISGCSITGYVVKSELEGPYLVTKVVDGDTADLEGLGRVRFSGINTPEKGDCYYKEAKEKLDELIMDKYVYVERDITDKGKYGRLLRYVYLNETMINGVLVQEGYARVYDKYSPDTKRYYQLKDLEEIAKENNLGVWNCN